MIEERGRTKLAGQSYTQHMRLSDCAFRFTVKSPAPAWFEMCYISDLFFFINFWYMFFSLHWLGASVKKVYINSISSCMEQFVSWDTFKLLQQFNVGVTLLALSVSARFKESGLQDTFRSGYIWNICGYSPHAAVIHFERFPQSNSFIYVSQCVLTET